MLRLIAARLLGLTGYQTFVCYMPHNRSETFHLKPGDGVCFHNPEDDVAIFEMKVRSRDLVRVTIRES